MNYLSESLIKRQMDWEGLRVEVLNPLQTGVMTIPVRSIVIIEGVSPTGLRVISEPCPCCGVQLRASCVKLRNIMPIDDDENRHRLKWNQTRHYAMVRGFRTLVVPEPYRSYEAELRHQMNIAEQQ